MTHSGISCKADNNGRLNLSRVTQSTKGTCDEDLILTIDDVMIKPGCQNYSLDGVNWMTCDRVFVYDIIMKKCVNLMEAVWEPCPIFYNTVDEFKNVSNSNETVLRWTEYTFAARRTGHSNVIMCTGCILNYNKCSKTCSTEDLVRLIDTTDKRSSQVIDARMSKPPDVTCTDNTGLVYLNCYFNGHRCKLTDFYSSVTNGIMQSSDRTKFVACYEKDNYSILTNDSCNRHCKDSHDCQFVGQLCVDTGCISRELVRGECFCSYSKISTIERFGYDNYEFAENTCELMTDNIELTDGGVHQEVRRVKRDSSYSLYSKKDILPDVSCKRVNSTIDCGELQCDYRLSIGNISLIKLKSERAIVKVNESLINVSPMLNIILYCENSINYEFVGMTDRTGDIALYIKTLHSVNMCDKMSWWQRSTHTQCLINDHMNIDWALKRVSMAIILIVLMVVIVISVKVIKLVLMAFCWRKQNNALDQIADAVTGNLKGSSDDLLELAHLREMYKEQNKKYSLWRRLTCWKYRAEKRMIDLMFRIGAESKMDVASITDKIINLKSELGVDFTVEEKALSLIRTDSMIYELPSEKQMHHRLTNEVPSGRSARLQRLRLLGLAVLLVMAKPSEGDEKVCAGHITPGKFTSCQNSDDGKTISCDVTTTARLDILSVGQSLCISVMNKSDVVMKLDILYEDLSRIWSTSKQYSTGSYEGVTAQKKICRNGGYCDQKCNGQTERNHLYGEDSTLIGYENEMYTKSVCCNWLVTAFECGDMRKCGGVSMSLNTYGLPRSDVHSLIKGENAATIMVNHKVIGESGRTEKTSARVRMGSTESLGRMEVTLIAVSNLPAVEFNDNKLILNETTAYLAKAVNVNDPKSGILGEIQCDDVRAWDSPLSSRAPYQSTFKVAEDIMRLSCDEWNNYYVLNEPIYNKLADGGYPGSISLPGVYGGNIWRYERNLNQLVEEINGTRPISIKIDIKGSFDFSVTVHKCSPEIRFLNLTGCLLCEYGGAELTIAVASVNGYGCHVVLNHISNQLTCIGSIPIETGEPQVRSINCYGKAKTVDDIVAIRYDSKEYQLHVIGELVMANYTTDEETVLSEMNSIWNEFSSSLKGLGLIAGGLVALVASVGVGFLIMGLCVGWSNLLMILGGFTVTRFLLKILSCGLLSKRLKQIKQKEMAEPKATQLKSSFYDLTARANESLDSEQIEKKVRNSANLFK